MGWLNNIINKAKEKVKNAVNGAVQTGQQAVQNVTSGVQNIGTAVQNAVQTGQQVVQNTAQGVQNAVQGAVQQGQQAVQNIVQNASQSVADKVNSVNDQIQGTQNNTSSVTQVVPSSPAGEGSGTQTPSTVPQTAPSRTPEQNNTSSVGGGSGSSFDTSEPILTYEDYLKREESGLGYIKDETTKLLDKQSTETLEHIDQQLESDNEYAEDVKTTTETSLQKEKDEVYAYVDKMLGDTLAYNNESYNALIENITGLMEQGKIQAGEAKELLIQIAEETKNATYGAAERQREEAERQANINRQRAITDANSAYEQNKASYGAKAEALGNMGLAGGGYGDWLNATAYAQNRSEVQGARAQSDKAKTDAKYTEDMTKLDADLKYSDQKQQAESDYLSKVHDIDTTYATNLGEAEQWKLKADKDARDAADATKRQVDSDYNTGKLQSDLTYSEMLHGFGKQASENELKVNQDTDAKKLQAEIDYVTGILNNSKALAEYKESLKAGDAAAEEKKLAVYEELLRGVSNGTYTADDAKALADAFGLSDEWKNSISNSAQNYADKIGKEEEDIKTEQNRSDYTSILVGASNGTYDKATASALAKEYGLTNDQIAAIEGAADTYKTAQDNAKSEANDEVKKNVYINLLDAANRGGYTEAQIENLAKMYELTDDQVSELKTAARNYVTENADAIAKDESTQKSMTFVELLNGANSGAYSEAQIAELAKMFGFSETEDEGLITILKNAAKAYADGELEYDKQQRSATFVELLNGANSGAYSEAQIAELAKMFGFSETEDEGLITILKNAANAFDSEETANALKNDKQYQNGVYAELLSGVNTGAYTGAQAADLANRFGLDDEAQDALIEAGETYLSNKETEEKEAKEGEYVYNKNALKQQVTSDTTDEEIQSWLDDDLIDADGVNSLKEHRKTVAVKELDKLINDGNLESAAERADKLYERGVIDTDAYQKTYFDASIVQCENVTSSSDINREARNLESLKNGGKISKTDYNNALKYLYQISTGIVSSCKYLGDRKFKVGDLEIPGNVILEEAKGSELSILNGAVKTGAMTTYGFAMVDGKIYFQSGNKTWYLIKPNGSDSNRIFYAKYTSEIEKQSSPTRPQHVSGSNTTTGSDSITNSSTSSSIPDSVRHPNTNVAIK